MQSLFQLANSFNVRFMETSCKTGENVDEAFNELTQQIKEAVDRKVCWLMYKKDKAFTNNDVQVT